MSDFLKPAPKTFSTLLKRAINKRFKEGRGNGTGKHYKPFLEIRDVASKGRCHRVPSITHGRVVHLLSDLELVIFYLFDWHSAVIDIREQFPLNPQDTFALAESANIPHPEYGGVKQVMTTDFVVDMSDQGEMKRIAISAKYAEDLEDPRTLEKQELERRYWKNKEVPWYIITEQDIPPILVKNIRWLIPHFQSFELSEQERKLAFNQFIYAFDTFQEIKIPHICAHLDEANEQEPGTYLSWLRHLLAQRAFVWDMNTIAHTKLTSADLTASDAWLRGEINYVFNE